MHPDVSFVLPVYNKAAALPYFFASLLAQTGDVSFEVVFVDDVSTDNSLEILNGFAATHDFVRVITNRVNAGPSIRLNQGVKAAKGTYLALFDCDEVLAPDAVERLMSLAKEHDADMVHGLGHKTKAPIAEVTVDPIGESFGIKIYDDPLERVLGRGMVRMTWLVERALFEAAGGCDADVFIQDESLPLRLSFHARRVVDADMIVTVIPDTGSHLSANKMQQHHDRFFVYAHFLESHRELAPAKCRKLFGKCLSAVRKAKREGAPFKAFDLQSRYLAHKIGVGRCDPTDLKRFEPVFQNLPDIRRPVNP